MFEKGQANFQQELERHGKKRQREQAGLEARLGARIDQVLNLLGDTKFSGLGKQLLDKTGVRSVRTG